MAFAKRKLPLVVGAEAAGEIAAVGAGVDRLQARRPGGDVRRADLRHLQGLPRGPRQSVRERRRHHGLPRRRLRPRPASTCRRGWSSRCRRASSLRDAACAPIAFATVEHMLFDNAKLKPGETILVHAGGSGIGTVAIKMAKAIGCTVITTVGDDDKAEKAKALGADHVINYRTERFESDHAQAHRQEGRRRGVRACRRRRLQRLAARASSAAAGWSPAARPRGRPSPST